MNGRKDAFVEPETIAKKLTTLANMRQAATDRAGRGAMTGFGPAIAHALWDRNIDTYPTSLWPERTISGNEQAIMCSNCLAVYYEMLPKCTRCGKRLLPPGG